MSATTAIRMMRRVGACLRTTRLDLGGRPSLPDIWPSIWPSISRAPGRALSLNPGRSRRDFTAGGHGIPPLGERRLSLRESDWRELHERARVDQAFEVNHFLDGLPVRRPPPLVEFGFIGLAKVELHIGALQSQQEPPLLLSNAHRTLIAANVTGGKPVPQPAGGTSDKFDVSTRHSDLLVELA